MGFFEINMLKTNNRIRKNALMNGPNLYFETSFFTLVSTNSLATTPMRYTFCLFFAKMVFLLFVVRIYVFVAHQIRMQNAKCNMQLDYRECFVDFSFGLEYEKANSKIHLFFIYI